MSPGMALIVTLRGSNYRCLEQIFMVPKGFEPSKFDYICYKGIYDEHLFELFQQVKAIQMSSKKYAFIR